MFDINKTLNDFNLSPEQYENLLEDCEKKSLKEIDIDWSEISEKYNLNWSSDTIRKASQVPLIGGSFVKEYYEQKNAKVNSQDDEYIKKLEEKEIDLKKQTIKMRDERNALNKVIREQARKESIIELFERIIKESVKPFDITYTPTYPTNYLSQDMVISFTDVHAGLNIHNHFNDFDNDVLIERVQNYLEQIIKIQDIHHCENAFIIVSETISGYIHDSLRIQNNENVIEQFKFVAELLSSFIEKLSEEFNEIHVYTCNGNHSRLFQNKEQNIKGENLDVLIPFYLKAKLKNYRHIYIEENYLDTDIATFDVRENYVVAVHGDKDDPKSVVHNMTLMVKKQPDLIYLAHRHTNAMMTFNDTKVIQSGCFCASDEYAIDKRLVNKPEQTISIINDNGLVCLYDIKLKQ